jgi:hypothetical protein
VFAISSGSTPACLTSKYALCAPKFSVTINETCLWRIKPMPLVAREEQYCSWEAAIGIRGSSLDAKADLFDVRSSLTLTTALQSRVLHGDCMSLYGTAW